MNLALAIRDAARQLLRWRYLPSSVDALHHEVEKLALLVGRDVASRMAGDATVGEDLSKAEFRVFSQFGDDGIIQYLVRNTKAEAAFVEFGVEDYSEANTRFLLMNNNWRGLVIDAEPRNIRRLYRQPWCWRHELVAVVAFLTAENVNTVIAQAGFSGAIGLVSIDVDGNDYWLWKALTAVEPTIVVVEYNGVFGSQHAVTVPYDPGFSRAAAHHSRLYFGASLAALSLLGESKGYSLVGCNSAGNNAYFVRRERLGCLRPLAPRDAFVAPRFREARDPSGRLTYQSHTRALTLLGELPIHDVRSDSLTCLGDLLEREETSPQPQQR